MGINNRHMASLPEQIAIRDFLATILSASEGGLWTYKSGWDDHLAAEHVSKQTGTPLKFSHVKHVRNEMFGNIFKKKPPTDKSAGDRIAGLEREITDMQTRLAYLESVIGIRQATLPFAKPPA